MHTLSQERHIKVKRKNEFKNVIKLKCLQCSDRHCCLCDKQCSTSIEIHHIIPIERNGNNSFDNAIPLCFDCHAKVELYNEKHPRGNRYRYEELKSRRNQVYDKYTSPFLPNVHFEIKSFEPKSELFNAGFIINNTHQYLPCKVKMLFTIYCNNRLFYKYKDGIYGRGKIWVLNPTSGGNFPPNFLHMKNKKIPVNVGSLRVQIETTIIDKFGWEHALFPVSWIWNKNDGWFFEPFLID